MEPNVSDLARLPAFQLCGRPDDSEFLAGRTLEDFITAVAFDQDFAVLAVDHAALDSGAFQNPCAPRIGIGGSKC